MHHGMPGRPPGTGKGFQGLPEGGLRLATVARTGTQSLVPVHFSPIHRILERQSLSGP